MTVPSRFDKKPQRHFTLIHLVSNALIEYLHEVDDIDLIKLSCFIDYELKIREKEFLDSLNFQDKPSDDQEDE